MSTRQDSLEERLINLEDKLTSLQEQLEMLPEALTRCLAQHAERIEQRRNFLHPDTAVALGATPSGGGASNTLSNNLNVGICGNINAAAHHPLANLSNSPLLPHSRSVPSAPSTISLHPWPASPVLPPVSSRTPHLIPETGNSRQQQQIQLQQQHTIPTTSQSATRLTTQAGLGGLGTSLGSDTSPHS